MIKDKNIIKPLLVNTITIYDQFIKAFGLSLGEYGKPLSVGTIPYSPTIGHNEDFILYRIFTVFISNFVIIFFAHRVVIYQTKSYDLSNSKLHAFLRFLVFGVFAANLYSLNFFFHRVVIYQTKCHELTISNIHVFLQNYIFLILSAYIEHILL